MLTKITFLFLFPIFLFGYTFPFYTAEDVYFSQVNKKSVETIDFIANDNKYQLFSGSNKSIFETVLADLFIGGENKLTQFAKKYNITLNKKHLELINKNPSIAYGSEKKDNSISQIWLQNETGFPLKVLVEVNGEKVILNFLEFNNNKYGYLFPTKISFEQNGKETIYQITNITVK